MPPPEPIATDSTSAYQIGDLVLDVGQARLTRDDSEIPLPRLSFDLLEALAHAAPRVLTTDELMTRVWRGVIVSPETISQRVKLLRDALGDDAAQPRYVASVRGRGYKLVAGVTRLSALPMDQEPPGQAAARAPLEPGRRRWLLASLLALLAAFAIFFFATRPPQREEPRANAVATRVSPRAVAVLPFKNLSDTPAGSTLALGIADTLRHQLAGLKEIDVIGYSSSTALGAVDLDAREVGKRLRARYLLGGSVQSGLDSLRVTAQLTDSDTGLQLWSIRFDRAPADIFAMEDEIAIAVAKALALTVDADTRGRLTRQGTTDFDSYLAYLQGRALLASGNVRDARLATVQFQRAIDGDGQFAPAYVALAEALVFAAEYDSGIDRGAEFTRVVLQAQLLVEQALSMDPTLGSAYLERGYLRAFSDLKSAEEDLRRGLQLSPNDARGYAKLASIVFADRRRGAEAVALLDRARRLEPLEPEYDVTKAVYLLYGRGDVGGADELLVGVLQREPLYVPALGRLAEVRFCCQGRPSDAVQLGQQTLAIDPLAEWARRVVIHSAAGLNLPEPGLAAVEKAPENLEVRRVPLLLLAGDARAAAEIAYRAIAADLVYPIDEPMVSNAIREDVRQSHDYERAIASLEKIGRVSWTPEGEPQLSELAGQKFGVVALGDVLLSAGQRERGQRLLEAALGDMDYEARTLGRSDAWFSWSKPIALTLLGRREAAFAELERPDRVPWRASDSWYYLYRDPALKPLQHESRFRAVKQGLEVRQQAERARYLAMHPVPEPAT